MLLTTPYNRGKKQMIKSYICMLARGQIFLLEVQDGLTLIQFLRSQQWKGGGVNMYASEQANLTCVSPVLPKSLLILKEHLSQSPEYIAS